MLTGKQVPTEIPPHPNAVSLNDLREIAVSRRLYAVLDACDAPEVPAKCAGLGEERAVSLYRGSAEEMYWAIAPYLAIVDEVLLDWIVAELWEEPWGIFAVSDTDLETLQRHFRRFLVVQSPDGEQWYFRYYDPRVLPTFLGACTQTEIDEIFGPVEAFAAPLLSKGMGLLWLRRTSPRTRQTIIRRPHHSGPLPDQ